MDPLFLNKKTAVHGTKYHQASKLTNRHLLHQWFQVKDVTTDYVLNTKH